jgi:histidine phosphotransferase ChpT
MKTEIQLLKLLSSKLCHDLIQPVNSLKFAMDMLKDDDNLENKEAFEIAYEGVNNLVHRVSFFRMALGGASLGDGEVGLSRVKELIFELYQEKDTKIEWTKDVDSSLATVAHNDNLKVILNIFLVIFYIVQKNTTIRIYCGDLEHGKIGLALAIKGNNIKLGIDNIQALKLESKEADLTPRNIQCYYTAILAKELGSTLEVRDSMQGEIQIACTLSKKDNN